MKTYTYAVRVNIYSERVQKPGARHLSTPFEISADAAADFVVDVIADVVALSQ